MKQHSLKDLPGTAQELIQYWLEARGADTLPDKSWIDPLRLRRWIGDVSVMDVREGEKRYFVRLHGANATVYIGTGFERQYLEDCIPAAIHEIALEPYHQSVALRCPTYSVIKPGLLTGAFEQLERLVLPFWTDDPQKVGRFLVWVGPSKRDLFEGGSVYGKAPPADVPVDVARKTSRILVLDDAFLAADGEMRAAS